MRIWSFALAMALPTLARAQTDRPYSGISVLYPDPAKGGPAAQPGQVRWLGFEPGPESSRFFIQLTSMVEPEVSQGGGVVTVRLPGLRLSTRNMRRPIVPRFFATPVRMVRARNQGADVVVRIALKRPAEAKVTTQDQGGYRLVILEFPPGEPDANGRPAAEAPPAETPAAAETPAPAQQ
jgi:hypothetical protein